MGQMGFSAAEGSAAGWIEEVKSLAFDVGSEDWQAGGSFPDLLHDLKRDGHITDALYIAGCRLSADMQRVHGTSAGLVSQYGDQVDGVRGEKLPARFGTDGDAFRRMATVLHALRAHERTLLTFCILARELDRGSLADWGRQHSAFKTRQQSRAMAVGQICSMLETIADAYRYRVPIAS